MKKTNIGCVAVVLVITTACSTTPHSQRSNPSPTSSSTTASGCPVAGQGRVRVAPVTTLTLADPWVADLATWGHYVAWDSGPNFMPRTVYVRDLDTAATRVIAHASSQRGELGNVEGGNDTVIYLDLVRVPSDENQMSSPWRIYAVDLKSGARRLLRASHNRREVEELAAPRVDWPWMVDADPRRPSTKPVLLDDVYAIDLRDGSYHVIVPDANNPAAVSIASGVVVYGAASGPKTRDLYTVPVNGSTPPRRLTTSGQVSGGSFSKDGLTWEQPLYGEKNSLWFMPAPLTKPPIKFAPGGSNEFPGRGFVVWLTSADQGQTLVAAQPCPDAPRTQLEANPSIPARWAVSGNRVVWATVDMKSNKTTIHVVEIQPN